MYMTLVIDTPTVNDYVDVMSLHDVPIDFQASNALARAYACSLGARQRAGAQPEVQELPEPRKTSTGRASDGSRLFMQKPAETLFEP